MKKLAVLSVSGGMDSASVALKALEAGYDIYVLNFNYGQKNIVEMESYKNVISELNRVKDENNFTGKLIGEKVIDLTPLFSEFLELWQEMRDNGKNEEKSNHTFYMPSRNLLFGIISTVVGEIIALNNNYDQVKIGLGIHMHSEEAYGTEHRDYWDITPEFAKRLNNLLELNDVKEISLFTPFVDKTKDKVLQYLVDTKFDYNKTWTCYNPIKINSSCYSPCYECESCKERELAGEKANITDVNDYTLCVQKGN